MIENTSNRDPLLHLAGAFNDPSRYITEMEKAGQSQVVNSTSLPTEGSDALAALGFKLGPVGQGDDLFREVTLPDGWSKQGSDHDMWSYVVDHHGRRRVSVFYKAAFYDRRAFLRVNTVDAYVYEAIDGRVTALILDENWATVDATRAALVKAREDSAERIQLGYDDDGFYTKQVARCDELLAELDQVKS